MRDLNDRIMRRIIEAHSNARVCTVFDEAYADITSFITSYLPATESKTLRTRRVFSSGVTRS